MLDDASRLRNHVRGADEMADLTGPKSGPVHACITGALGLADHLCRNIDELSSGIRRGA